MFIRFSKPILENNKICIFRHCNPDGDAVCSQLALKTWIERNFKDKEVKVLGNELSDIFPYHDEVDDEFIKDSLAIILDTANTARIDDQRYALAKQTMKIDHHIVVEEFGDYQIVNPKAAATCEILTFLFLEGDEIAYRVSEECAKYLYAGILTDTQSFTTSNTTKWTINAASNLAETGIDIYEISNSLFERDINDLKLKSSLFNVFDLESGVGSLVLNKEALNDLNTTAKKAKDSISYFNNIKGVNVWYIAVENEDGLYDVSIRSRKAYHINEIANNYGGGGHLNAVGIKGLVQDKLASLKQDLIKLCSDCK